jgi:hypothetical protein
MKPLLILVMLVLLPGCAKPPVAGEHTVIASNSTAESTMTTSGHPQAPSSSSSPTSSPGHPSGSPAANQTEPTPAARPWSLAQDGWAPVAEAKVFSGVQVLSYHGDCSVNYVFTDPNATRVFVGTAAHCAAPAASNANGGPATSDYCANLPSPDADQVQQRQAFFGPALQWASPDNSTGLTKTDAVGHYVYNSNLAMAHNETVAHKCLENDFALIEVDAAYLRLINPSTEHWGGIKGPVAAAGIPAPGSKAYTVGGTIYRTTTGVQKTYVPGPAPQELTRAREGYFATYGGIAGGSDATTAVFDGGCLGGDSGSPVLDAAGHPFGVVERSTSAGSPCVLSYLQPMLDYMFSHRGCAWCLPNDIPALHLIEGTETFKPGPLPDAPQPAVCTIPVVGPAMCNG